MLAAGPREGHRVKLLREKCEKTSGLRCCGKLCGQPARRSAPNPSLSCTLPRPAARTLKTNCNESNRKCVYGKFTYHVGRSNILGPGHVERFVSITIAPPMLTVCYIGLSQFQLCLMSSLPSPPPLEAAPRRCGGSISPYSSLLQE